MSRGPEYADRLTGAERRTLDVLLAEMGRRHPPPEPARPRRWRAPVAAGLAAMAVLLAGTAVDLLGGDPPSATPAASGSAGAATELLAELAGGAAAQPGTPSPVKQWYRHRLHVVVAASEQLVGHCRITALTTETWESVRDPDRPSTGRLVARSAAPPVAAQEMAGCRAVTEAPVPVTDETGEVPVIWAELAERLGESAPRYTDAQFEAYHVVSPQAGSSPAGSADGIVRFTWIDDILLGAVPRQDGSGPPAARWWALLGELLASPAPGPAVRAAALRTAAERGEAVAVPEVTSDVTGRPGVTVRVPYAVDGGPTTTAELTFDAGTGALRQRVVHIGSGLEITVYLATRAQ